MVLCIVTTVGGGEFGLQRVQTQKHCIQWVAQLVGDVTDEGVLDLNILLHENRIVIPLK